MIRLVLAATLTATLLASPVARAADPELPFEKYTLKNGLTVILSEDHRLPQVAVDIWYHVGAANQTPGKSGFAHLFEHMMFSGSKHVQPDPWVALKAVGVVAGNMANGTTDFDRTNYFETVPANELATALWIESDRMAFLLDTLDAHKLAVQRDVVSNERRERVDNQPYGRASVELCDTLYPAPHPYYECVIGRIDDIQAATVDDLKTFFRTWYGPQNASLAIVGDFEPAQAKELIERYFGPIVAGPTPARAAVPQPMLTSVVRKTVSDKLAELPRVTIAWNGVRQFSADEAAGDVLATILGEGNSSRLHRALVFEQQVASDISADDIALSLGGYFSVSATARAGHRADELTRALLAEVARIKRDGPTAAELERAQRRYIASWLRSMELIGGKAELLNQYQTYAGDAGYLPKDIARYRAVTPEAVKAFANHYLSDDKRLELTTIPASASSGAEGR